MCAYRQTGSLKFDTSINRNQNSDEMETTKLGLVKKSHSFIYKPSFLILYCTDNTLCISIGLHFLFSSLIDVTQLYLSVTQLFLLLFFVTSWMKSWRNFSSSASSGKVHHSPMLSPFGGNGSRCGSLESQ